MRVLIEIPKRSCVKYEQDKETGLMLADRIVPMAYPENYGFVPNTLADDGDPLDVFVISDHSIAPGTLMDVIVVCMIEMLDNDEKDHKLVAVFLGEDEIPYRDLRIKAIRNFLTIYKPNVQLGQTVELEEAENYLEICQANFTK